MSTPAVSRVLMIDDVPVNPLAAEFCEKYEERREALADLLFPLIDLDKPNGFTSGEDGERYRPETDEECQTLRFSTTEEFTVVGGDRFEERAAEGLEAFAAKLLELAGRVRAELVK